MNFFYTPQIKKKRSAMHPRHRMTILPPSNQLTKSKRSARRSLDVFSGRTANTKSSLELSSRVTVAVYTKAQSIRQPTGHTATIETPLQVLTTWSVAGFPHPAKARTWLAIALVRSFLGYNCRWERQDNATDGCQCHGNPDSSTFNTLN